MIIRTLGMLVIFVALTVSSSEGSAAPLPPILECDDSNSCISDAPYDLSGVVNNVFEVTWPAPPNTSNTTYVSNSTELQAALNAGSTVVVMADGVYAGSTLTFRADDIDVVAGNNVFVEFTQVSMNSRERIRITGGNWGSLGTPMRWTMRGGGGNGLTDILWNDFNFYGRFETRSNGPGGGIPAASRLAIINSTFDGSGGDFKIDGTFFITFNDGYRIQDLTIANVRMDNNASGNYVNRIQQVDRLMILDVASNMNPNYPGTVSGLRMGDTVNGYHVQDSIIGNRIFGSLYSGGGIQQFSNGWFENVTRYTRGSGASPWATSMSRNPPNDGTVNNCTVYSDTGGEGQSFSLGSALSVGPDGNSPVQSYVTLPDVSSYGAQR